MILMDKFATSMTFHIYNENLDKNHRCLGYLIQTTHLADSSLDVKIYTSKQKKLNHGTAFLITNFPLFTAMLTSRLAKEAELKNAQPPGQICRASSLTSRHLYFLNKCSMA